MRAAAVLLAALVVATALPFAGAEPSLRERNLAYLRVAADGAPEDAMQAVAADASARGYDLAAFGSTPPGAQVVPGGLHAGKLVHFCTASWTSYDLCPLPVFHVQTPFYCFAQVPDPGLAVAAAPPGVLWATLPAGTLQTPTEGLAGGPASVAHHGGNLYGDFCFPYAPYPFLVYVVGNGVFVPS